jgi:hypothetical protein
MSDTPQIIKIPISKIMPNEDQPRHRFQAGSIQEIADSMKALGQLDPAKVRPLTEAEKASYTKEELYWHKEGDPLPNKTLGQRGLEYMLIGGHRRREGALLAGFETLDCIVLNIAPEETHLTSLMDNNREEMDWWDWDLAIETESKAFPDMTQRELAKRLGISKSKVNNALILTKALNEYARSTINGNLGTPPYPSQPNAKDPREDDFVQPLDKKKPYYRITESILLALLKLDPDTIGDILELVVINEMNENQAKRFAQWILDGNETMKFDLQGGSSKPKEEDPLAEDWKDFGPGIKVKYKGGEDYEIHLTVSGGDKALKTARAAQKAIRGGIF